VNKNKKVAALLFAGLLAARAWSAEPVATVADCEGITDVKSRSRQLFESKVLMPILLLLEAKGEARFHL